ncbi:RGM domain family member B-like [Dendronephthya gigantea]|uniref:RGM domain family member B-like n=1 Tax=Dendronephthya gigantea TaxID=151771 RepID=UPI00106B7B53|nr:RGM domain family member B-like [Dendronephthya gigantea]XP_028406953.1 RGM domain family member B-like [Dendronephthya gigantea]XP_028406954.1 RGM domain family member B-like [Dendronephthya gigantea]XP_028406955.1 RGM domain family member B-like [Dendronephthya gigantea]
MVNSLIRRNIIQLHLYVCFVFILLLYSDSIRGLSLMSKGNDRCQKCIEQNRQLATILERKEIENVKQSCVYVKEFLRCAEPLESTCRLNLNFQGALTLMRSFKERNKCASMNITVNEAFRIIDEARRAKHNTGKNKKQCRRPTFKPVYKICGLFGDPHLRTFSDKRHTCSVPGAWPLFANRYLTVQVTNIPLENSSRATATSKVTVIVRGLKHKCIEEKMYQARSFSLPAHFSDGTKSSGDKDCATTVTRVGKGRRVIIDICPLKTEIIIRQVGKYLTVHMRVPKDMTRRKTFGLCQRGCPRIEQMNLDKRSPIDKVITMLYKKDKLEKMSKRVKRQRQERARRICGAARVRGFYYKSCLFDMLTSDDASFAKAARKAMKDFRTINVDDNGNPIVNETARDWWTGPTEALTEVRTTVGIQLGTEPNSSAFSIHKRNISLVLMMLTTLVYVFR